MRRRQKNKSFEWSTLLGNHPLVLRNYNSQPVKDLSYVKVIGLYFSAHWCPPCRQFTPMLAKFYKQISDEGLGQMPLPLEIVFVSSDQNQKKFEEYLNEMPWSALNFADRKLKSQLMKKFNVRGIPSLVLLDGQTGELLTTKGRQLVSMYGSDFAKKALDKDALKKVNAQSQFPMSGLILLLLVVFLAGLVYNGTITINV